MRRAHACANCHAHTLTNAQDGGGSPEFTVFPGATSAVRNGDSGGPCVDASGSVVGVNSGICGDDCHTCSAVSPHRDFFCDTAEHWTGASCTMAATTPTGSATPTGSSTPPEDSGSGTVSGRLACTSKADCSSRGQCVGNNAKSRIDNICLQQTNLVCNFGRQGLSAF